MACVRRGRAPPLPANWPSCALALSPLSAPGDQDASSRNPGPADLNRLDRGGRDRGLALEAEQVLDLAVDRASLPGQLQRLRAEPHAQLVDVGRRHPRFADRVRAVAEVGAGEQAV